MDDMDNFDLLSAEKVAAKYGGDKRKIGEAAQMGLVNPTVAVMAGMFIDRMRAAAIQEQQPNTTVAQDVMAPTPQMAGLGATPQAQAPTQMAAAPTETRTLAGGGLSSLPVDEDMFPDEYAGGGIVAFQDGGGIDNEIAAAMARRDIPLTEGQKSLQDFYGTAESRAAARKEQGFNEFLTEMGFRAAASKSPRFLQAVGEAGAAATPRLTTAGKEARDIEESARKGLAEFEGKTRAEKLAAVSAGEKLFSDKEERLSRKEIAAMPKELTQTANTIFEEQKAAGTPISREEAFKRATGATTREPDRYTAISNRLAAANKDIRESTTLDALKRKSVSPEVSKKDRDAAKAAYDAERQAVYGAYSITPADLAYLKKFTAGETPTGETPPAAAAAAPAATAAPASREVKAPPAAAVNILKADPSPANREFFDTIFGPGAAAKVLSKQGQYGGFK